MKDRDGTFIVVFLPRDNNLGELSQEEIMRIPYGKSLCVQFPTWGADFHDNYNVQNQR
jgi:hypothetical protein